MSKRNPQLTLPENVVLINIGKEWKETLTPAQLYERTRRYWVCQPANYDAKYAMCVAKGVVREVYEIDQWSRVNMRNEILDSTRSVRNPSYKIQDRWVFSGKICSEMARFVGADVGRYRKHGNANPLIWMKRRKIKQAGIDA